MIAKIKYNKIILIVSLLSLFNPHLLSQNPYTDPLNTENWVLNTSLSDDFNGSTIDESKWIIQGKDNQYQNGFKGRAPSQFVPSSVSVENGYFTITTKWDPTFTFLNEWKDGYKYGKKLSTDISYTAPITTGAIISRNTFKYGYMEIKCKAADGPISSSYWTTGVDGELDVFEHYGNNPAKPYSAKRYHTSFHDWRNGSATYGTRIWTNEHLLDFRVADEFHVYGLEWAENFVKIYIDGKLIRCVEKSSIVDQWTVYNVQKVWLDCETFPWEVSPSNLSATDFPGEGRKFIVDYVRVWQKPIEGVGCIANVNLVKNSGIDSNLNNWNITGAAILSSADYYVGPGALKLNGLGSVEQTISGLKPNTNYVLSVWAKLPGTNMSNIWHNAYLGIKNYGGVDVETQFFRPTYTLLSLQFKTGASNTSATIYFKNKNSAHIAYADNFEMFEAVDLSINATPPPVVNSPEFINPGFEDADLSAWTLQGTNIVSTDVHSGTKAAHMVANNNLFQFLTLEANTQYTVSCYAKVSGTGSSTFMGVTLNNGDVFISNVPINSTVYRKYNLTFITTQAGIYKVWAWSGTTGDYYFDDFEIIKNVGTGLLKKEQYNIDVVKINNNTVSVSLYEIDNAKINVFNINGQCIYQCTSAQNQIVLDDNVFSKKGIYILDIRANNQHIVKKIII